MQRPRRIAVFAGPSLPVRARADDGSLTYLPPAARGDVERAARAFDAVLLIDGVFHHELAPSPKECFAALAHARMFGAASMGALRAVECAPFGFTPLGIVAQWYRSERIDGDDEVAVSTHPRTHAALSVPMVNVRFAARAAYRRGILHASDADLVLRRARGIFYAERSWLDVASCLSPEMRSLFVPFAEAHGDVKRLDARFALRSVLRRCA